MQFPKQSYRFHCRQLVVLKCELQKWFPNTAMHCILKCMGLCVTSWRQSYECSAGTELWDWVKEGKDGAGEGGLLPESGLSDPGV